MHIFLKKRTDLPEITRPIALLCIFLSVAFAWLGAKLAVSYGAAPLMFLPFLAISAAVYSVAILLWRKFTALLITPITAAVLLLSQCNGFCVISICLSLLFISYLTAVYLLSGQTRFMRMTSLSCVVAITFGLCALAWFSMHFSSLDAFYEMALTYSEILLKQISLLTDTVFSADASSQLMRSLLVSAPALLGIIAELFAASILFLCGLCFRLLDCAEYFHSPTDNRISSPRSFGAVSLCTLFLMMFTSPYDNPLLYNILSNIFLVIAFPCAYVGIREFYRRMQQKYFQASYYFHLSAVSPRRFIWPMALFLFFIILILGISNALLLSSAIGAMYILSAKKERNGAVDTRHE